ncbi:hypothetical protein NPIL_276251 [Nephila pilipes]|uniref:Uncharacterized protein n=1 Tax=Nephila pilipes TaxID=299642 RepID=A0A8X6PYA5_NEPPI|nr:hypothetical protein NPIL_276251 [Nephila pilipes]
MQSSMVNGVSGEHFNVQGFLSTIRNRLSILKVYDVVQDSSTTSMVDDGTAGHSKLNRKFKSWAVPPNLWVQVFQASRGLLRPYHELYETPDSTRTRRSLAQALRTEKYRNATAN